MASSSEWFTEDVAVVFQALLLLAEGERKLLTAD